MASACKKIVRTVLLSFACLIVSAPFAYAKLDMAGKTLAITTHSQSLGFEKYGKALRSQLESIFADNDIKILDLDKVDELKNNWDQLDDPSSFITAEDFLERAEQFSIDGIVSLYYHIEVSEIVAGYYSASAVVIARIVNGDADVKTQASIPMGTLGYTPSDGLTMTAAVVNALRREADRVATEWELEIFAPQNPVFFGMELVPVEQIPSDARQITVPASQPAIEQLKLLHSKSKGGKRDKVTCEASVASTSGVAALGIYTSDLDLQRNRRSYGSSVVISDISNQREINQFIFHELGEGRKKYGSAKIHQCQFFNGWRFLVAASSRGIKIFDLEKGREIDFFEFDKKPKKVSFTLLATKKAKYLKVNAANKILTYELRQKG